MLGFSKRQAVYFRMLGTAEVLGRRGRPNLEIATSPKALGILAFLALTTRRGPCTRDRLVGYFWPGSTDDRARHCLRQILYRLKRMLGPDVVETRGQQDLWLSPDAFGADALDLLGALDRGDIAKANALYDGELLPGFHLADASPDFECWLSDTRRHLRRQLADSLWAESHRAGRTGDTRGLLQWGKRAAAVDPYNELELSNLLQSLARGGYRADALRIYGDFRARLLRDLELEPGPEIERVAAWCRSGEIDPVDGSNGNGRVGGDALEPQWTDEALFRNPILRPPLFRRPTGAGSTTDS